jgi:hypothetical protein
LRRLPIWQRLLELLLLLRLRWLLRLGSGLLLRLLLVLSRLHLSRLHLTRLHLTRHELSLGVVCLLLLLLHSWLHTGLHAWLHPWLHSLRIVARVVRSLRHLTAGIVIRWYFVAFGTNGLISLWNWYLIVLWLLLYHLIRLLREGLRVLKMLRVPHLLGVLRMLGMQLLRVLGMLGMLRNLHRSASRPITPLCRLRSLLVRPRSLRILRLLTWDHRPLLRELAELAWELRRSLPHGLSLNRPALGNWLTLRLHRLTLRTLRSLDALLEGAQDGGW